MSFKIDFTTFGDGERVIGSIGGRTLYRKIISTGTLPNTTTKTVAHGISNLASVVSLNGAARNPTTGVVLTLPFVSAGATGWISVMRSSSSLNSITIETGSDRTGYTDSYVTIEYTKE